MDPRLTALALPLLALTVGLCGCGLGRAETSVGDEGGSEGGGTDEEGQVPSRPLEIGDVSEDGILQPWADGELVEVVIGVQGYEMIVFYVEAPIEAGDPDEEGWCVRSKFTEDPEDPFAGASSYCHGLDTEVVGEHMRLGPVWRVLTTKELRGGEYDLAVELSTDGFVSVEVVTVELY